ncbi:ABC transporter substrate-binding protein [Actinoallomurus sp. CA-150999]|uniref:ABC transporter substrate-binding protein n=1 Tax=Actinoallomurus sp. CA-150999 TaxID=3239887 RepID=UPI003D8DC002
MTHSHGGTGSPGCLDASGRRGGRGNAPHRLRWLAVALTALTVTATACSNGQPGTTKAGAAKAADTGKFDAFANVTKDDAAAAKLPARIKSAGKLVVVMNVSSPPTKFYATDNKTIIGLNPDLARALGRVLGVQTQIQDVQLDGIIPGLSAKHFDFAISSMSATPERLKVLDMVRYGAWGTSLAVAKGNPLKLTTDSLCGHKVAVQQGSIQEAERLPGLSKACQTAGKPAVQPVVLPSQTDALVQLGSGRADAVLADTPVLAYAVVQTPGKFQLVSEMNRSSVSIGLPKGSDLTPAIQAGLSALMKAGTYQAIFDKWGLKTAVTDTPDLEKTAS